MKNSNLIHINDNVIQVFNLLPFPILICDLDILYYSNSSFSSLIGNPTTDLTYDSVNDILINPTITKLFNLFDQQSSAEVQQRYPLQLIHKQKHWIDVLVEGKKVLFQNKAVLLLTFWRGYPGTLPENTYADLVNTIQEQELQLEHSTRLAELGEMASAIAHEINQPLTSIRNFAKNAMYMIENNLDSPMEINQNLKMIADQVDRASRIINQMRKLARKSDRVVISLSVNHVLLECLEFLATQLELANIDIHLNLSDAAPKVKADRIALQQVFINIFTNAMQAMETSTHKLITIITEFSDAKTAHPEIGIRIPDVVIRIKDSGHGFSEEEAMKIFKPFFSTKEPGKGTGLGLSIAHSIIKDLNGKIEARGYPNNGAEFVIWLPMHQENG